MMERANILKTLIPALLLAALLTGCVAGQNSRTLIVLQNPKTKETKECKADAWSTWDVYAATEACAKAYEKIGFKRVGGY